MNPQTLILIRDDGRPSDDAEAEARSILGHCPECRSLRIRSLTVAEALKDPTQLDATGVVWVVVEQAGSGALFELIGELQDRHAAVMLTRRGEGAEAASLEQDGVVLCPPEMSPEAVCATLQALRSQVPVVRAVTAELKMLRAHQGGLCDQIGRIDEELRLAAQLQREFLPKSMVSIRDVGFRVLFRPASYVSGDIYDVVRLDERHIGFFIADAVGHGVPAALLTMFIKRSLVTKRIDPSKPRGYRLTEPGEALQKLNRDLVEQQGGHVRFATACYGVIDCETLHVCIARAGHPFPLVLRANGRTESLSPDGGLLGVFADETYEQVCLTLEPGDRLLLYSDGFEMAFPDEPTAAPIPKGGRGKRVASTRYAEEFEDLRDGAVDDALARLAQKLDEQSGSLNQRDDLTLVCLAVAAAGAAVEDDGDSPVAEARPAPRQDAAAPAA